MKNLFYIALLCWGIKHELSGHILADTSYATRRSAIRMFEKKHGYEWRLLRRMGFKAVLVEVKEK